MYRNIHERKWGKWRTALEAFIKYVNSEKSDDESSVLVTFPVTDKHISQKIEKFEKRDISLGLRYKVLSRDRFKCVKCGNSPSIDPRCVLHIDHIHPYSKDGKTILENLQTTCNECNLGKGNRYFE